ncbi:hypothetical protein HK099_002087 [Clydaea vesicula]|uniref:C2 domain-containing protein n=1 Tax=Clydaea vesicula TaxID=447962 RepID=A0AAD5U682_9FUNG|nr:hypothetical protein HK099_002087 [Clydaea vesicula]
MDAETRKVSSSLFPVGLPPARRLSLAGRKIIKSTNQVDLRNKIFLRNRLTVKSLIYLLQRIGPPMTVTQILDFIFKYDTSCTGSLDFDDFLELLSDYESTISEQREVSNRRFMEQVNITSLNEESVQMVQSKIGVEKWRIALESARNFLTTFPSPAEYFQSIFLDNPENYFGNENSLTDEINATGKIFNENLLQRNIMIRCFLGKNLTSFVKLKKIPKSGIHYYSIDPLVRVSCAGIVKETSTLIGQENPEDQELNFQIKIPAGDIFDVQQWVQRQVIEFALFDYNSGFSGCHKELIGKSYIPLSSVLLSSKKPLWTFLTLESIDCVTSDIYKPQLEVFIVDQTLDSYSWPKLVDAFPHEEDVWMKHYNYFKNDLLSKNFSTSYSPNKINLNPFDHYRSLLNILRESFKRRSFNVIAMDENENFRFLPCFITPTKCHKNNSNLAELATAVSNIPLWHKILPFSPETTRLSKFSEQNLDEDEEENKFFWSNLNLGVNKLKTVAANYCTHNFYSKVDSPSRAGANAYVAIGKLKTRPYVWVVTIEDNTFSADTLTPLLQKNMNIRYPNLTVGNGNSLDTSSIGGTPLSLPRANFFSFDNSATAVKDNCNRKVFHWDPTSGACYSNPEENDFAFERIETLFNNENLFFNIQKSDLLIRNLLEELVDGIQSYRMQKLMIPNTYFHRKGSQCIQLKLFQFEKLFLSQKRLSQMTYLNDKSGNNRAPFTTNVSSNRSALSVFINTVQQDQSDPGKWHYTEENDSQLLKNDLEKIMFELCPGAFAWRGTTYRFLDTNIYSILDNLIKCGSLDVTSPGCLYTIGIKTFRYAWGMESCWVGIGVMEDLDASEIDRP